MGFLTRTRHAAIPARVSIISRRTWNGGHGDVCRVVVESGRVRVWTAAGKTVLLADQADVVSVERAGTGWTVTVAGGGVWDVAPGGCACGSPLKRFDPKGDTVGT